MIINKIWIYLGWYYISLSVAIIYVLFRKRKVKIINLVLVGSLFLSLQSFKNQFLNLKKDLTYFSHQLQNKNNYLNSRQINLLENIKKLIPADKKICYPWPSDISGRYAQQYLYPASVSLATQEILECDYLVFDYTVGNKQYSLAQALSSRDKLIFTSLNGEIWQIKKQ